MWLNKFVLLLGCLLHTQLVQSWISCTQNSDCVDADGAVCVDGNCACPAGQQLIFGNSLCSIAPPYIQSPCFETHQCSRLVTNFECRGSDAEDKGECYCRQGFHYLSGRCWRSIDYGNACVRDEECMGQIRDPFSMSCDGSTRTCQCSDGYYFRQRGECRRVALAINDRCVIDEDCQFQNGACNILTFQCYESRTAASQSHRAVEKIVLTRKHISSVVRQNVEVLRQNGSTLRQDSGVIRQDGGIVSQHGAVCNDRNLCANPFVCSSFGICICPDGYYGFDDSNICYAELGSPSTAEQCTGFLSEVRDGICTCPVNFFFSEDLRNCIKVSRKITDSCMSDDMCHTFGTAVRCSEPATPWPLRHCECIPGRSLWDESRSICRSFVGIGESCQMNSDCLAGDREIDCVINPSGQGTCTCPPNSVEDEGLCLTFGLDLGASCQVTKECTGSPNSVCYERKCSCGDDYLELGGTCVPAIGGICTVDAECMIENSVCVIGAEETTKLTCQCARGFVPVGDVCMPALSNVNSTCNVTEQCVFLMGQNSVCEENQCECTDGHHLRDGGCWPQTGLFQDCARTSQCYLRDMSERVVCRNSLCQCDFRFPYSEELHTCMSSASSTMASIITVLVAAFYVLSHQN